MILHTMVSRCNLIDTDIFQKVYQNPVKIIQILQSDTYMYVRSIFYSASSNDPKFPIRLFLSSISVLPDFASCCRTNSKWKSHM